MSDDYKQQDFERQIGSAFSDLMAAARQFEKQTRIPLKGKVIAGDLATYVRDAMEKVNNVLGEEFAEISICLQAEAKPASTERYQVEETTRGCHRCGSGKMWTVLDTHTDTRISSDFGDEEHVGYICDLMNQAHTAGTEEATGQ